MAPDRMSRQSVTGPNGYYQIDFDQSTGDFLIYAADSGYRTFRKRVLIPANAHSLTIDIQLAPDVAVLAAVRTVATIPHAKPEGGSGHDPTALEETTSQLTGLLSPDRRGNLAALAATVPGISLTPDGSIVAFGLANQTSTTLNGMNFPAGAIPADARAAVRVISTAYDPSIGGFGGARMDVELYRGLNVAEKHGSAAIDGPLLQSNDPLSSALGQRFSRIQLGGSADGPIGSHQAWYNLAIQGSRQTASAQSLLDASSNLLSLSGVASDSAARLRQIAAMQGIPLTARGIPSAVTDQDVSFVGRFDHFADPERHNNEPWHDALSLTSFVSLDRAAQPGGGPLATPGFGQRASHDIGMLTGEWLHSSDAFASELRSSLSATRSGSHGYLGVPAANVLIASDFGARDPVTTSASLGGNPFADASQNTASWETVGVLRFYVHRTHKLEVYGSSIFDQARNSSTANQLGTFDFASLTDLENGRPSSFSRSLAAPSPTAREWRGAFAVGDLWQVAPSLQLQPGVRLEANQFLSAPARDAAIEQAFEISNAGTPNSIHASPRFGFAWTYAPKMALHGNFVAGTQPTGHITLPIRGILSGGFGEFRNDIPAGALIPELRSNGIDNAGLGFTCIGAAAPTSDWAAYAADPASIPTACAGGVAPELVDAAPSVALYDPAFSHARSWRGNLQWGSIWHALHYSIEAVYSDNIDQPGRRDLNFANAPQFTLSSEGDRPVFVPASSIVSSTGLLSTTSSRRTPAFGHVIDQTPDLHSTATEATIRLVPWMEHAVFGLYYTLSSVRVVASGFDATTFGSPLAFDASRSPYDRRHQFIIQTGYRFDNGIGASLYWNIESGAPYTPRVSSDVNGDGFANDRAFIFDPSTAADSSVAAGMRDLLATSPSPARHCLARQLGGPAAPNSCEGPWMSTMNAALATSDFHIPGGRTASAQLVFTNPLGGLDQLLHGNDHLHGWGGVAVPDPTLLVVRGFDPQANRFLYDVNPRFGSTRGAGSLLRAAFRITLRMQMELGTPVRVKQFDRFLLLDPFDPAKGPAPVDTLERRLSNRLAGDYLRVLLADRDSLLLTRDQVDSITRLNNQYLARAELVYRELALYIAGQAPNYDLDDIIRHKDDAVRRVWSLQRAAVPGIVAVLVPAQRVLAEDMLQVIRDSDKRLPPGGQVF